MPLPVALLEHVAVVITSPCLPRYSRSFSSTCQQLAKAPKDEKAQYYSKSLRLPRTAFPLRADAGKREQLFWRRTTDELYAWQAEQTDRPLFVLHDGPPYANGNLHCGHALNKITKDIINRSKLIQGHRIHYVPGYDTHGLPLELKALSTLKKPASSLTPQEIRSAARNEAEKGIATQGEEFRSFCGIGAFNDEDAYKTMNWQYERRQLSVVKEMVRKGFLVTHHRPTLYSPSSRTALAEAELEYRDDHTSRSVYVAFPVVELGQLRDLLSTAGVRASEGIALAAWTTTPWTLPSNAAIAVSPDLSYAVVRNERDQKLLVVAEERIEALSEILGSMLTTLLTCTGDALLSTTYACVFTSNTAKATPRPVITAPYVTATTGTGLVHTSPAHGIEDWEAWRMYLTEQNDSNASMPEVVCAVDADGRLSEELKRLVEEDVAQHLIGKSVLGDGTAAVIELLEDKGRLLKEVEIQHKFPYDWRTKKPVIFRASSQWFANLADVKEDAVKALNDVRFVPARGQKTLEMFVRGRSEWCISRQRAWGVPIPVVYSYPSDASDPVAASTPYLTPSNIDHIISTLDSHGKGTDYWWDGSAEEFVEADELERSRKDGRSWRKGLDTMDVWFDSGCSWTMLKELDLRPDQPGAPYADVYLEGSDQHRGWFQSSLLTAISAADADGGKQMAPYGTVVTHGMVLDEKGRKMSKSLGNVISPSTVIKGGKNKQQQPAHGTDLLRVWVASVDWTRDVLIGPAILAQTFETLKKIRNTARFMLGNTAGSQREDLAIEDLGLIDRYVLHELYALDQLAREGYNTFMFSKVFQALSSFSSTTLSSFYFDIAKDSLYADSPNSLERRRVVFTLQKILDSYIPILAPVAPLLAEEIHHFRHGAVSDPGVDVTRASSVFQQIWAEPDRGFFSSKVKADMDQLLVIREDVMVLLEKARAEKLIGSSTEAEVIISKPSAILERHADVLQTLFIVSKVSFAEESTLATTHQPTESWSFSSKDGNITVRPARHAKCPRCWMHTRPTKPARDTCARCEAALAEVAQ